MKFQQLKTAAAVAAALGCVSAFAQESIRTEEVTVTASRVERELMDVNMSVSVITREQIERSTARSVGELLESIPGVRINNDGGQGMKRVKIRGENAFRTVVMIDGQRVAEHKSMSGAPMLISPSEIERIEVIKGPASVLYGSDAIGGAINIITKKGGSRPVQGEVSAGLNTSASGKSASASIYGALDGWKYRLSAGIEDNGNLHTPKGDMENTYFSARNASGFLSYDFSPDATVGGSIDYYDLEFGSGDVNTPGFAVDVPKWTRVKTALFGEFKNISESLVRLRTDAFYQRSDKDMTNTVPAGAMGVVWPIASNTTDQYGFSVQSDWQIADNHYLIVGYELSYDKLDADSITKAKFNFMPSVMVMGNKTYDGYQMTNALYASMESALPADLTLTYGVRYTWVRSDMDTFDNKNSTKTNNSNSDGKAVFNVGLLWHGIENLTLRANYAQGYRNPILQELYVDTAMGQGTSTTYANADLKPEESDNFEIGARWVSGALTADIAAFYSKADNYIDTLYNADLKAYRYENVAQAETFGAELSASVRLGASGFEPYAVLTWTRRQYDDGQGFSTYDTATPALTARYGVRWSGELRGLNIRTDAYARSQTATEYRASDSANNYRLGGYTTLNLTGGVSFGPQDAYSLDAGFYNIFNQAYREQRAVYEPGRYLAVKLNAKF